MFPSKIMARRHSPRSMRCAIDCSDSQQIWLIKMPKRAPKGAEKGLMMQGKRAEGLFQIKEKKKRTDAREFIDDLIGSKRAYKHVLELVRLISTLVHGVVWIG